MTIGSTELREIERILRIRGWSTRGIFYALKSRTWTHLGTPEEIADFLDREAPLGMPSGEVRTWGVTR